MTKASRLSNNALCSISCSLEENRLKEDDCEMAEILAAGDQFCFRLESKDNQTHAMRLLMAPTHS